MAVLYEYVRNIAVFMIFSSLAGALIPEGKFKGYANMVMGVILVLIMLSPVAALFRTDFNGILADLGLQFDRRVMAGEFAALDDAQNQLILSAYRENLSGQLERFMSTQNGYDYVNSFFVVGEGESDFGHIKEIHLTLAEETPADTGVLVGIIRIEPITAGRGLTLSGSDENDDLNESLKKIKNAVSDFYNIPSSNIYITVQKSDGAGDK